MKAHYKRKKWYKKKKVHYVNDEDFSFDSDEDCYDDWDDLDDLEDLENEDFFVDNSLESANISKSKVHQKTASKSYINMNLEDRRNQKVHTKIVSSLRIVVLFVVIFTLLISSPLFYLRFLNSIASKNLSTVYNNSLNGTSVQINELTFDLNSIFLSIREVSDDKEDLTLIEKIIGSKKSDISSFIKSLESGKVNFCKVNNLVLFGKGDDDYNVLSSDKIKVRYSDFEGGYLLEVNNKFHDEFYLYYSEDGEVSLSSVSGNDNRVMIRSGLTQVFIPSNVDVHSLCVNLVKLKG